MATEAGIVQEKKKTHLSCLCSSAMVSSSPGHEWDDGSDTHDKTETVNITELDD
jgi:hypothetical protein